MEEEFNPGVFHPACNDHFITRSTRTKTLRDRQADLLRCVQIDDELKLFPLLHRQVGGFCTFENRINIRGCAPKQIGNARSWSSITNEFENILS
jgi:hypothetical protein